MTTPALEQINAALATVNDPEIKRPITELGMVESVEVDDAGTVARHRAADRRRLPAEGHHHPRRDRRASARSPASPASTSTLGVMTAEQRAGLQETLRGGQAQQEIPFAQPGSLTKVFAIASGKGGVGKSSVTVNLALAMASRASRSASSTPTSTATRSRPCSASPTPGPTQVEDMIMPVPTAVAASR